MTDDGDMTYGEFLGRMEAFHRLVKSPDTPPEARTQAWRDWTALRNAGVTLASPFLAHIARPGDLHLLDRVAEGVFDGPVDLALWAEFLAEPSHVLAVILAEEGVVAMASGVRHIHPDKPAQLWINEVGTGDAYQRRGLARAVLEALLAHGRDAMGCAEAWVLTDADNGPARGLYKALEGEETTGCVMATFRI